MTDPRTKPAKKKEPKKEEEPKEEPKPDLPAEIIRTVLAYGDQHTLRLTEALGSLTFAALELYVASKSGIQKPELHEDDDKTEPA